MNGRRIFTGCAAVLEVGRDADGYYAVLPSGLRDRIARRGSLEDQRERFRYRLRNEYGMRGDVVDGMIGRLEGEGEESPWKKCTRPCSDCGEPIEVHARSTAELAPRWQCVPCEARERQRFGEVVARARELLASEAVVREQELAQAVRVGFDARPLEAARERVAMLKKPIPAGDSTL